MKKLLLALLSSALLAACAEITASPQSPAPSAPVQQQPAAPKTGPTGTINPDIIRFEAMPSTIEAGSKSVLGWEVTNATSVNIDQGIGPVPSKGNWLVEPGETTTYTLSATNKYGTSTMRATVTVQGTISQATVSSFHLPVITVFEVKPANIVQGENATLVWDVQDSFDVEITPGFKIIKPKGSAQISPMFTTHYKLTANNGNGSITASTTVTVSGTNISEAPVIKYFKATPYVIKRGTSSILSWESTEGSSASIDHGIGIVDGSGSVEVKPSATTTYMLTVSNPRGAQFQTVVVNVR